MGYADDPDARVFLRHIGHWDARTAVDAAGSLYAVWRATGYAGQLAEPRWVREFRVADDMARQSVAGRGVELWVNRTRVPGQAMRPLPRVRTWGGDILDRAYSGQPRHRALYENAIYVTLVKRRAVGLKAAWRTMFRPLSRFPDVPPWMDGDFEDLCARLERGLGRYRARRLGVVDAAGDPVGDDDLVEGDRWPLYSEPFQAWRRIACNDIGPVPLSCEPMGRLIVPHEQTFGDAASPEGKLVAADGRERHFAVFTFKRYPARTFPLMWDDLWEMPCGLTVSNAEVFRTRQKAVDDVNTRMNQKESASSRPDFDAIARMKHERDRIEDADSVPTRHRAAITLFADTLDELNHHASRLEHVMGDAGVVLTRQGRAIKAAFYSQIPGNFDASPKIAPTTSEHTAAFGSLTGFSPGRARGRWHDPSLVLCTTALTEYPFHFHIPTSDEIDEGDRGNVRIQGPPGSGKTTIGNLGVNGFLRLPHGQAVLIDNRLGASVFVEAHGGTYAELVPGHDCCNLLATLDDTEEDRVQAKNVVMGAIESDRQGGVSSLEDERIDRAIARQLRMPRGRRSLWGVLAMLPKRKTGAARDTAAARLRPWCRGRARGWALDAARDTVDLSRRICGFDTTKLMRDPVGCGPVMATILYRVRNLAKGRPFLLYIAEAWQIDLVPHLRPVVEHSLATLRKDEGVVVLDAQKPETFSEGASAASFRNQVPTSIWFADPGADRVALARDHHLTRAEIEVVTVWLPNNPFHFLLKRPGESLVCKADLAGVPGAICVLSARRATYDLMRRLQAEHGRDPRAWLPRFMAQAPAIAADPITPEEEADAAWRWEPPEDPPGERAPAPTPVLEAAE